MQSAFVVVSNLLKRNTHGGVHLWIVLGNRLEVVVPTCLFSRQSSHLERLKTFLARLECAGSNWVVHTEGAVSLGQFHSINLGAQEGNIRATITSGTLHFLSNLMTVTPILLKQERRRIPASLEVSRRWLQGTTAFVQRRLVRFEPDWRL